MPFIGFLVGGFVGAAFGTLFGGEFRMTLLGAIIGLIAGIMLGERSLKRRAAAAPASTPAPAPPTGVDVRFMLLERRIADLETLIARSGLAVPAQPGIAAAQPGVAVDAAMAATAATDAGATMDAPMSAEADIAMAATAIAAVASAEDALARAPDGTLTASVVASSPRASAAVPPAVPLPPVAAGALQTWLAGGNTLARVGILVLFIGVAFLLKYATEHVTVPIELRITAVVLGGIALLAFGWRLRRRRHAYAMILQGGGIGVLYLSAFAALKLYALIPAPAAFALMAAIAALSGVLAVRQDAIALAVVGVIGGFLAPILTASQSGNHVALFSYYALLNAGIFGIAWFRAWRPLNVLGFVCTFIVATVWGVMRYRPQDFASTEPFLVLFFLFYVAIAVLYALRRSVALRDYVDGTIVFGTPLVAAGLQHGLVRHFEFGMALSALAAAALYLLLARALWAKRSGELRLLVESFLALGVVFATLAVPLAFDARWTSATWALEGAAIAWVGIRQGRIAARAFGLFLQLSAGMAFALNGIFAANVTALSALPIVNSAFVGATLVALGGLVSALVLQRGADLVRAWERALTPLVFAWGVVWWLCAGGNEIGRFVAPAYQDAALVAFATATAIAFAVAARRLAWPIARVPALLLGPALLLMALLSAVASRQGIDGHLFAHGGVLAWPLAIIVDVLLLRRYDSGATVDVQSPALRFSHAVLLWLVTVVVAQEIAWLAAQYVSEVGVWRRIPWGLVPALALASVGGLSRRTAWPLQQHRRAYLVIGATPLVLWMLEWMLAVGVGSDGNPAPLPYVPIVNPVDLAFVFIAATLVAWGRNLARAGIDLRAYVPREILIAVPAALLFLWTNAVVLRTIHHWFGIDWSMAAMWQSTLVQATLSLLWTMIALATMLVANRRRARAGWTAGAVLLGVVVTKLFIIDLSRIGSIERIVSFIGVGLLLLLIGYLAPVPPRDGEAAR